MKSKWFKPLVILTLSIALLLGISCAHAESVKPSVPASAFRWDNTSTQYDGTQKDVYFYLDPSYAGKFTYTNTIIYTTTAINAGDHTVTAIVTTNESDEYAATTLNLSTTLHIAPAPISSATGLDLTYNGQPQTPQAIVTGVAGSTLVAGKDYTITGSATDVGSGYTATVSGIGNYTGTKTITYNIKPSSDLNVSLSATSFTYTGSVQQPQVTVTGNGSTLVADQDYTVSMPSSTSLGNSYTVTVTGKGNYTGTRTATYAIVPRTDLNVSLSATSFVYNGKKQQPKVTVTSALGTLKSGTDYTVDIPASTDVNNAYVVTVTGKGNYTGIQTATYAITPCADLTVKLSATSFTYNGKLQQPKVTVTGLGSTLVADRDYTVSIPNSVDADTYTVTVIGQGNFSGTKTVSYTIKPIADTLTVKLDKTAFTYNAQSQKPKVTVTCGIFTLREGWDYTVTFPADTTSAGTKVVQVQSTRHNFTGSGSNTYTINPKADNVTIVLNKNAFVYNGREQRPQVLKVTCGDLTLPASDYTLTLPTSSLNADTYTITAATSANITKDGSITYTIAPNPGTLHITLDKNSFIYNGAVQKPVLTKVTVDNLTLTEGTDYTASIPESVNGSATYTINLTGKGNFSGTGSTTYTIAPFDLKNATVNLAYTSTYYTSKLQQPAVTMTYPGAGDVAFTTAYSEGCTQVGDYTVTVTGTAPNFTGTNADTFKIQWLPTPSNPITLVGKLNAENGWYYDQPVQITPPAGYTIGYGTDAASLGNPYLTMPDGTNLTGVVHLMNAKGEITDGVTIPTYKQDTMPPNFNVSISPSSPLITADAQDKLSGAIIIFNAGSTKEEIRVPADKALTDPIYLHKLQTYAGTYSVVIVDEAGNYSFNADAYAYYFGDSDGDGLIDAYERYWGTDPHLADTDGDGLDDGKEYHLGTDPRQADTDGDGVTDGDEVNLYGTDPTKPDTDGDGIDDLTSILYENYFARSKQAPTALNLMLHNPVSRTAAALQGDALTAALSTLHSNGYLSPLTVNPYTVDKRNIVSRGNHKVKVAKGAEVTMFKADAATSTLWGLHEETGLMLAFTVGNSGRLDITGAISLPELFGVEALSGLSVMTDDSASIFVIGNWDMATNSAASDLIVVIPAEQSAWTIADTAGCTRFDVSPDGSKIAYVTGSTVNVLDLATGNPLGVMTAEGQLLGFTAEGKIITALSGHVATVCTVSSDMALATAKEDFYGLYCEQQPTLKAASVKLLVAGGSTELVAEDTTIELTSTGYATARGTLSSLAFQRSDKKNPTGYAKYFQAN